MLVLTRRAGESLKIGDDIEVKVLSLDGDQVRIGLIAPKKIPIFRSEIYESIARQNRLASQSGLPSHDLISRLNTSR